MFVFMFGSPWGSVSNYAGDPKNAFPNSQIAATALSITKPYRIASTNVAFRSSERTRTEYAVCSLFLVGSPVFTDVVLIVRFIPFCSVGVSLGSDQLIMRGI